MILWFIYIKKCHPRYSLTEPQPSKQVMQDILLYSYSIWNIRHIFVKVKNKQTKKQKKTKTKTKQILNTISEFSAFGLFQKLSILLLRVWIYLFYLFIHLITYNNENWPSSHSIKGKSLYKKLLTMYPRLAMNVRQIFQ